MAAQKLIIHVRSATAQREIPVEMVSEGLAGPCCCCAGAKSAAMSAAQVGVEAN